MSERVRTGSVTVESKFKKKVQKKLSISACVGAKLTGTCRDGPCLETLPGIRFGRACGWACFVLWGQEGTTASKKPFHHMLGPEEKATIRRFGRLAWRSGFAGGKQERNHSIVYGEAAEKATIRRFGRLAWRSGFAGAKHKRSYSILCCRWRSSRKSYDSAIRAASVAIWICGGQTQKEPFHSLLLLAKQQKKLRFGAFGRLAWRSGFAGAKHKRNHSIVYICFCWRSSRKKSYDSAIRAASVAIWICGSQTQKELLNSMLSLAKQQKKLYDSAIRAASVAIWICGSQTQKEPFHSMLLLAKQQKKLRFGDSGG